MIRQLQLTVWGALLVMVGAATAYGQTGQTDNQGTGGQQGSGGLQLLGSSSGGGQTDRPTTEGVGQISGEERYLRENRQVGDVVGAAVPTAGFVGQTADGGATGGRAGAAGGAQALRGNQGFMSLFNGFNQSNLNTGAGQRRLRIPLRLGFSPQPIARPMVASRVQRQFTKIPQVAGAAGLTVRWEGSTAVLRGRVRSQDDQRLAVQLALLEPGVSDVRSELIVGSPTANTPSGPALPAPRSSLLP